MFEVDMSEPTRAFVACWVSAMKHLDAQVQGGVRTWLKDYPGPPVLEHISFRLGNQLFFLHLQDADGREHFPGNERGLLHVAARSAGHACVMPMRRARFRDKWSPVEPGWGLLDARSGAPVDPVACVTNERIEMTVWECQDLAVQVVRQDLLSHGCEVVSWSGNPDVDPSLWFARSGRDAEFVLVRFAAFPDAAPVAPFEKMRALQEASGQRGARGFSNRGHYAAVCLRNAAQQLGAGEPVLPLWRGHAVWVDHDSILSR
jgi:hypothetical protein